MFSGKMCSCVRKGDQAGLGISFSNLYQSVDPGLTPALDQSLACGFGFQPLPDCVGLSPTSKSERFFIILLIIYTSIEKKKDNKFKLPLATGLARWSKVRGLESHLNDTPVDF